MRKHTILCMLGSLIVALSLACEKKPAPVPSTVEALLKRLPREANVLAFLDVADIRETFLYKRFEERHKELPRDLEAFIEETGFDPRRDIDRVVLSAVGDMEEQEPKITCALVQGKFDRERIERALREREAEMETYRGYAIYSSPESQGLYMTFLDETTAALGNEEGVRKIIALHEDGGESAAQNTEMRTLVEGLEYKDQMWGIVRIDDAAWKLGERIGKLKGEFDVGKLVAAVRTLVFSAEIADRIGLSFQGVCTTEEEAELLAKAVRGGVAFLKIGAEEDGTLIELLEATRVTQRGNVVSVQGSISKAL
ncbi:TPA: hypothetical protein EYP12_03700, partial [Candidatus Bipolaricaulota bacterium]|nr:hypothetical protein [Candidatus Bipolaricaulota bacterium]